MDYTPIVGLEVHVQLLTRTKLFCGCENKFNPDHPNEQTCPVCLGMPGALPVMNREAFTLSLRTALALNCGIPGFTKWDRKQYYYPDLPKAYQISQYDLPFSEDGRLEFELDEETRERKRVGIIRAHLEEDAGKNLHDESGRGGDSRVDLNRCGTPLLEIVTQPDIRSPAEARRFLEELKLMLMYLGVSDCNMQEGSLRCDANVNLHVNTDDGHLIATPIVEVKNMNSFRNVEAALEYEIPRQLAEWRETGHVIDVVPKQTRGWDAGRGVTFAQRGKEEASDYRYLPDPDLVPVTVTEDELDRIRSEMCELPADRRHRLVEGFQLSRYDAAVIIDQGLAFADYFEHLAERSGDGKLAANWVTQDVLRELNERKQPIEQFPITAEVLAALLGRVRERQLTTKSARDVFAELLRLVETGAEPVVDDIERIVTAKGLATVSDTSQLDAAITAVIERNPRAASDFQAGKQAAIGPLIGQVMREIQAADPKQVREMLIKHLDSV